MRYEELVTGVKPGVKHERPTPEPLTDEEQKAFREQQRKELQRLLVLRGMEPSDAARYAAIGAGRIKAVPMAAGAEARALGGVGATATRLVAEQLIEEAQARAWGPEPAIQLAELLIAAGVPSGNAHKIARAHAERDPRTGKIRARVRLGAEPYIGKDPEDNLPVELAFRGLLARWESGDMHEPVTVPVQRDYHHL